MPPEGPSGSEFPFEHILDHCWNAFLSDFRRSGLTHPAHRRIAASQALDVPNSASATLEYGRRDTLATAPSDTIEK